MAGTRTNGIIVRTDSILKCKRETEKPLVARLRSFSRMAPFLMRDVLYGSVLQYFKSVNRKAGSKLPLWCMKFETFCHVDLMIRVFKWVVLPVSLVYVGMDFYFLRQNALDSMFLGMLLFVYSNFLPDLPSIYRRGRTDRDTGLVAEDLQWYKKYALLLFAPLFIWAFLLGVRLKWKTTETFHNLKSLIIYGTFLLALSFLAFGHLPVSIGELTEIISFPFYGLIGYLTHLKVDLYS